MLSRGPCAISSALPGSPALWAPWPLGRWIVKASRTQQPWGYTWPQSLPGARSMAAQAAQQPVMDDSALIFT